MAEIDKSCFTIPWSKQAFLDECENKLAVYFVARENGRCIGYAGYWNVSGEGDITNVAVLPQHRNKRVASMLIEAVLKSAANLNLLTLEVRKSNLPARNLYEKYGFEIIGERKRYYSDNREDALIMMKKIYNTDDGID